MEPYVHTHPCLYGIHKGNYTIKSAYPKAAKSSPLARPIFGRKILGFSSLSTSKIPQSRLLFVNFPKKNVNEFLVSYNVYR